MHELKPFVDESYQSRSIRTEVSGRSVYIPTRLSFFKGTAVTQFPEQTPFAARCLLSRSTDGYVRQRAIRSVFRLEEAWVVPFVILLTGEYVVEIINDIAAELSTLNRAVYSNFTRENRSLMRRLQSRAISYWDAYYRSNYPDRSTYPGLIVLNELARWAS